MGLAAPRKKIKISHDPNNTNWSRSTSGFGHKILSSQGWTPGSFLGARNAAHAEMFTAASASHIKVVLKDDTLGLGARPKRDPLNEPTGLDAFKGLLGRLNGKSDADLQVEQQKRDNVKLARYAATKWQAVTFISGGLLAQEKTTPIVTEEPQGIHKDKQEDKLSATVPGPDSDGVEGSDNIGGQSDQSIKKKKSKSKNHREKKDRKRKHTEEPESTDSGNTNKRSTEKKSKATRDDEESSSTTSKGLSRERRPMGRHVFRGRHIAQKKAALMDEKSLNEVRRNTSMLKSQIAEANMLQIFMVKS
ncbi:telomerase inhibitor [Aspergillus niger]